MAGAVENKVALVVEAINHAKAIQAAAVKPLADGASLTTMITDAQAALVAANDALNAELAKLNAEPDGLMRVAPWVWPDASEVNVSNALDAAAETLRAATQAVKGLVDPIGIEHML